MMHACNCIGPQNGEPKCPCKMRGMVQRDGRWIERERDYGPVVSDRRVMSIGCICPPGAEATCQGVVCPRRSLCGVKMT